MHILIVEAPFYTHIADMQRDGVTEALKAAGATYDVITVPGALEVPAAIAFADAHPFKLFGLDKKPSMLLGMEGLRSFERVSVDFSTKKVTFLLPKAAAKP